MGRFLTTILITMTCSFATATLVALPQPVAGADEDSIGCSRIYGYKDADTLLAAKYNYRKKIAGLKELRALPCYSLDKNARKLVNSYLAYYYSFLGLDDSADCFSDLASGLVPAAPIPESSIVSKSYALDSSFFRSLPVSTRIVMLNEAHHLNSHREVARTFLQHLSQQGFNYFAVEGLWNYHYGESKIPYPAYRDGYYLQSRNYADLLLLAGELGFRIIAYEDTLKDRSMNREEAQAANIFNQTLRTDPDAKVFVYCGYSHIEKDSARYNYMAGHLKRLSGLEPLTVRQTAYYGHCYTEANPAQFDSMRNLRAGIEPFVVRLQGKQKADFDIVMPGPGYRAPFPEKLLPVPGLRRGYHWLVFREEEFRELQLQAIPLLNLDLVNQTWKGEPALPAGTYAMLQLDPEFRIITLHHVRL